jgi:hypothetical protein
MTIASFNPIGLEPIAEWLVMLLSRKRRDSLFLQSQAMNRREMINPVACEVAPAFPIFLLLLPHKTDTVTIFDQEWTALGIPL